MEGGERWRCDRGQGAGEEVSLIAAVHSAEVMLAVGYRVGLTSAGRSLFG